MQQAAAKQAPTGGPQRRGGPAEQLAAVLLLRASAAVHVAAEAAAAGRVLAAVFGVQQQRAAGRLRLAALCSVWGGGGGGGTGTGVAGQGQVARGALAVGGSVLMQLAVRRGAPCGAQGAPASVAGVQDSRSCCTEWAKKQTLRRHAAPSLHSCRVQAGRQHMHAWPGSNMEVSEGGGDAAHF